MVPVAVVPTVHGRFQLGYNLIREADVEIELISMGPEPKYQVLVGGEELTNLRLEDIVSRLIFE